MKVKDMALHKAYYDAMRRGTKKVEYRTMSDYWLKTLLDVSKYNGMALADIKDGLVKGTLKVHPAGWTHIRFHHLQDPPLLFEIDKIGVYDGHTTFAIALGKQIK